MSDEETEEAATMAALKAWDVLKWGGGDLGEYMALVVARIDLAPAVVQLAAWRGWLAQAAAPVEKRKAA